MSVQSYHGMHYTSFFLALYWILQAIQDTFLYYQTMFWELLTDLNYPCKVLSLHMSLLYTCINMMNKTRSQLTETNFLSLVVVFDAIYFCLFKGDIK